VAVGTNYNVTARYKVDPSGAKAGMRSMERGLSRLERRADRARRRLRTIGTALKFAIGTAVAGAVGLAGYHLVKLKKKVKDAKIALSSAFEVNELESFNSGMERSAQLIEDFRLAAAKSPGTEFDMLEVAKTVMPAIGKVAPSDEEITSLSKRVMTASHTLLGGDTEQAARDTMRMLMGSAAFGENQLFTKLGPQIMEAAGVKNTEEFNNLAKSGAKGTAKALDAVQEVLATATDNASTELGESFTGQWSTLKAHLNNFLLGAGGVFDSVTDGLKRMNAWFKNNQETVKNIAQAIGSGMKTAFETMADAIAMAARNADVLLAALTAITARKAAIFGGDMLAMLRTGRGADVMADIGKKSAALRRGAAAPFGAAAGAAGDMMFGNLLDPMGSGPKKGTLAQLGTKISDGMFLDAMFQGTNAITENVVVKPAKKAGGAVKKGAKAAAGWVPGVAGAGSKWGGAAMKGLGGITSLFSGLASVASTLTVVLAPLIVIIGMVIGTIKTFRDQWNHMTMFFWSAVEQLMGALDTLLINLTGKDGLVGTFRWLGKWGSWLAEKLGEGVVGAVALVTWVFAKLVEALNSVVTFVKGLAYFIGNLFSKIWNDPFAFAWSPMDSTTSAFSKGFGQARKEAANARERSKILEHQRRMEKRKEERQKAESEKPKKREQERKDAADDGGDKTTINLTLNQENKTDANPDRIAFRTLELFEEAMNGTNRKGIPKPQHNQ